MYNLRIRVKAVSAGSARPQAGMRARALPAAACQVTSPLRHSSSWMMILKRCLRQRCTVNWKCW